MMGATEASGVVVKARLDAHGHIVTADDLLLQLQAAAGGAADGRIAIPQLGAVARLVRRLGVLIARPLLIGGQDYDLSLWVRARPVDGGVEMELSDWQETPHNDMTSASALRAAEISLAPDGAAWRTDEHMNFMSAGEFAKPGDAFSAVFRTGDGGEPQLAAAVAGHLPFYGVTVHLTGDGAADGGKQAAAGAGLRVISGHPLFDNDGAFLGYQGKASVPEEAQGATGVDVSATPIPIAPEIAAGQGDDDAETVPVMPDFGRRLDLALRQPLGRIIANAETIKAQMEGPLRGDYTTYAADIASAGRHLMALVDDLADLQAIDRAGFQVAREAVDLADIARRAAGLLGVKAADRHIRVIMPENGKTIPAIGEFRRALQIIVNLLSNAIRYAPEGSCVYLDGKSENGRACLSVSDEGQGIDKDDREKIFEKFERLGRNDVAGSGLGLYISRRLARAMGGDLEVDDAIAPQPAPDETELGNSPKVAVSKGARFTLWLPVE